MCERSGTAVTAHAAPSRRPPPRAAGNGLRRRRSAAAAAPSKRRWRGRRGRAASPTVVGLPRLGDGWRVGCARWGVAGPSSFRPAVVTGARWEINHASASPAVVGIHRGPPVDCHPPGGVEEVRPTCWRAGTDGPGVRRGRQTGKKRQGCVRGDHKNRVGGGPPRWCVGGGIVRGGRAAATGQSPAHSSWQPAPRQAPWPRQRRHRRPSIESHRPPPPFPPPPRPATAPTRRRPPRRPPLPPRPCQRACDGSPTCPRQWCRASRRPTGPPPRTRRSSRCRPAPAPPRP